jgi:hypothetical protein
MVKKDQNIIVLHIQKMLFQPAIGDILSSFSRSPMGII